MVEIRQGEVWWDDLSEPSGPGPGFWRPILVIQGNPFNESRISTVVCIPLTSNLKRATAPGNVILKRRLTGLAKDSADSFGGWVCLEEGADQVGCDLGLARLDALDYQRPRNRQDLGD